GNMRSYFHKVIIASFDGVTRTTCFVLRPRNKNYLSYAYLTLFNEKTVSYSAQHSKGSTIPYAVWEGGLAEMKIIMPSCKIIDTFEKIISPILEISINTFFKLRNLRTARDLLLPKLISGELDVSDLEIVGGRW
ncbi:MAG: restriction endonuclease subunit S, partial [Nitrospirota bacterium]